MITIPLTQNKKTIINEKDAHLADVYKWIAFKVPLKNRELFYASAYNPETQRNVYLHRLIINAKTGEEVDHINGNGLDNRRSNLRVGSHRQNQINRMVPGSSKYPGVYYEKTKTLWRARAQIDGKSKSFGYFKDEKEAFKAYLNGIYELTGEKLIPPKWVKI